MSHQTLNHHEPPCEVSIHLLHLDALCWNSRRWPPSLLDQDWSIWLFRNGFLWIWMTPRTRIYDHMEWHPSGCQDLSANTKDRSFHITILHIRDSQTLELIVPKVSTIWAFICSPIHHMVDSAGIGRECQIWCQSFHIAEKFNWTRQECNFLAWWVRCCDIPCEIFLMLIYVESPSDIEAAVSITLLHKVTLTPELCKNWSHMLKTNICKLCATVMVVHVILILCYINLMHWNKIGGALNFYCGLSLSILKLVTWKQLPSWLVILLFC